MMHIQLRMLLSNDEPINNMSKLFLFHCVNFLKLHF